MSQCESYVTYETGYDDSEGVKVNCTCGWSHNFLIGWEMSVSLERMWAVWVSHLASKEG